MAFYKGKRIIIKWKKKIVLALRVSKTFPSFSSSFFSYLLGWTKVSIFPSHISEFLHIKENLMRMSLMCAGEEENVLSKVINFERSKIVSKVFDEEFFWFGLRFNESSYSVLWLQTLQYKNACWKQRNPRRKILRNFKLSDRICFKVKVTFCSNAAKITST